MVQDPGWERQAADKARAKGASCVACMVFMASMSAAIWIGTIWASQSWMDFTH